MLLRLPEDSDILEQSDADASDPHRRQLRLRQYFYSLSEVAIGGQCPCNGHADECPLDRTTMVSNCTQNIYLDFPTRKKR
jgi:hypothetical protein